LRSSEGILSKTDQIDARLLSCYGEQKRPAAWHSVSACAQQLKGDLDRLDEIKAMQRQESNRLENQRLDAQARGRIQTHIGWLASALLYMFTIYATYGHVKDVVNIGVGASPCVIASNK
jgi:hypothetical protein